MIEALFKADPLDIEKIKDRADKATFKNLRHAAFSHRKRVVQSIKKTKEAPAAPGEPAHTRGRGRHNIRGAMFVDVDKRMESAVIGPRSSWAGPAAAAHEFGGTFRGQDYPARPFSEPQLDETSSRFADDWQYSIGE